MIHEVWKCAVAELSMARVLIIDDDGPLLHLLTVVLRLEDLRVETAGDGTSGLECLNRQEIDLMILDLNLPDMDGREVFRAARRAGYEGPVVICSAYGAQNARHELGAEAALDKPFDPEALVTTVNDLLVAGGART